MPSNCRYCILAGLGVFGAVCLLERGLASAGLHGQTTFLDEGLLGIFAAIALFFFLRHLDAVVERRRRQQCAHTADRLNHHVRNALQVIVNRTAMEPHSASALRDIGGAVHRIDWALREILPSGDGIPRRDPARHLLDRADREVSV